MARLSCDLIFNAVQNKRGEIETLKKILLYFRLDEATLREWHRGFIQDCPNGKLKPEKFLAMYQEFFPASRDKAQAFGQHVYRLFDTDSNGYIDFTEFMMALHASKGSPRKRLQWAFK